MMDYTSEQNVLNAIYENPKLPFFIMNVINSEEKQFFREIALPEPQRHKVETEVRDYTERFKKLKKDFMMKRYTTNYDFLNERENAIQTAIYLIKLLEHYLGLNSVLICYSLAYYLNK